MGAKESGAPSTPESTEPDVIEPASETTDADSQVMELLSEKVPLSLIMDLSAPAGPDSKQILDDEGQPEDAWWEPIA